MNKKSKKTRVDTIVFAPTNGVGLGHLTRTLAIARRVKKLDPSKKIVFFTTCPAIHLVEREGFIAHYFPSLEICNKSKTRQWDYTLSQRLSRILHIYKPSMFIFDGAHPYNGILTSISPFKKIMKCIWIKKNQYTNISQLRKTFIKEKEKHFHYIITPNEVGNYNEIHENSYMTNFPIIYLDQSEALSKDTVRKLWQVPDDYKVVYIQLGAGKINDIQAILNNILYALKKFENIFIVLGESIIGQKLNIIDENVLILRDYPNSRFFNAFDLAISAVGYNTYHELLYFGVPTIFIPNENTSLDNQVARAMNAKKAEAALVLRDPKEDDIIESIKIALNNEINAQMRRNAKKLIEKNGADELAQLIFYLGNN
ncbi:hypothetical protein KQI88_01800 [Alkaliphilus sp. MSJ-5]|uniref:Glycosyl transferase family 28 C-terminal domain-containing protein n=1 Tax=Alkaliphilus flagellatus TaxID=2841507 RepID=A0ABS6FYL3_9FIRM|nr:glycosyltransferase [Alkaliphilus flagellatus]MBU5675149.1 hypothetical protein [Alkaliphilus flagellatus]